MQPGLFLLLSTIKFPQVEFWPYDMYITHAVSLACHFLEIMKKPWSPMSSQDNVPCTADFTCLHERESETELAPDDSEEKQEREKKHTSFTLCNVCNIQLNSAAQAQIHYNGKSHQKRLKQLSNGSLKNDHGRLFDLFCLFCVYQITLQRQIV